MSIPPPQRGGYVPGAYFEPAAGFQAFPGGLRKVAADPRPGNTTLWGINQFGAIFRSLKGDGSDWVNLPGCATDITIRSDGTPIIVSCSPQS